MNSNSLGGLGDEKISKELEEFMLVEREKQNFQSQVDRLNDICWDKCLTDKIGSKLDSRTETCLSNCVERFLDTSLAVAQRYTALIQQHAK